MDFDIPGLWLAPRLIDFPTYGICLFTSGGRLDHRSSWDVIVLPRMISASLRSMAIFDEFCYNNLERAT